MEALIVDALGAGRGGRIATVDAIGAGPRAVAGVLEHHDMEPRLATAAQVLSDETLLRGIDLLLISAMTVDLPSARRIVRLWRRCGERGPVVVGGPLASRPYDAVVRVGASLAVVGEGERTLEGLMELGLGEGVLPSCEELRGVRGVAFSEDGRLVVNPLRPVMPRVEYDSFTPSTKVIVDYPLYFAARVYVEVLRGCSNYHRTRIPLPDGRRCLGCERCVKGGLRERYDCPASIPPGCGYCSVPSLFGPPRSRSVRRIVEEISELLDRGVRRIVLSAPDLLDYGRDLLVEPDPLTDPRRPPPNYEALEELLSKVTGIPEVADGEAAVMVENVKANLVTERAAQILGTYLPGSPVNIGCETGSAAHSALLGRPSSPGEVLRAVELLRRWGLRPYVYFIHGLPGQSSETVRETVRVMEECVRRGAERIILYRFQPLPMSAFGEMPRPPPAKRDKLSWEMWKAARRTNLRLKKELLGRRLRVVLASSYDRDRRFTVAYPLRHGPVVLVQGGQELVGRTAEVIVRRVVSDRLVEGELLRVQGSEIPG
ncbi:radical SAM protein [Candidatus Bathyarchaeota archaeon]|nr:MAG: radical SAM protein [Candidatus Bathyarchaeota archaeon]